MDLPLHGKDEKAFREIGFPKKGFFCILCASA